MNSRFLIRNFFNLVFKRQLGFEFDMIPLKAERLSNRQRNNLFKIALNRLLPISRTVGRPYMAHISPSGLCDLNCVSCPSKESTTRGRELLTFETFKKFIDEAGDTLLYVILWSWGEPLLNPDFARMAEYAAKHNILTVTSTNLNRLRPDQARELVASGLDSLIIAVDGTTQESYEKYRKGGDFKRIIENVKLLVAEKKRVGAKKPLLNLRMVVSRENEHEVEGFRRLGRELEVDMVSFKAFSTRQSGKEDPDIDRRFAPQSDRYRWYRYRKDFRADRRVKKYWCRFPWTKPTLFADGTIIACEYDLQYDHSFGNINRHSFDEIWFGEKAQKFRRRFQQNRDAFAFCHDCVYDYKLFDGCVLERQLLHHEE